jgi:hypothetical protein
MPSNDALVYAGDERNIAIDNADMCDVEMMDENADDSMAEELDEISSPNWQEEVRINVYVCRCPLHVVISASPNDLDAYRSVLHGCDVPNADESTFGNLNACNICGGVF